MQIKLASSLMHQSSLVTAGNSVDQRHFVAAVMQKTKRVQLLVVVALLHILLIYALANGVFKQVAHTVPAEVFVTLISAESTAPQAKITPATQAVPKTNPVIEPTITPVTESPVSAIPVIENIADPVPTQLPTAASTTDAAPTAPVATQPKTISSGVEYIRAPQPNYPLSSKRIHEQGKTVVRVLVSNQGMPTQAEIQQSSGSARLDEAARQAVLGALFKPFIENGKAITVYALVPIRFQLAS